VQEIEASIEKGRRAGLTTYSVSPSEVSSIHATDYVEDAESQSITWVGVKVARLVVFIASDRRRRDADEQ
jgi:hypothetical protein